LQQYGIRAVIAPSFGEIFYSNAMNNQLLLVMLPEADIAALMEDAAAAETSQVTIDLDRMQVRSARLAADFRLPERHWRMQREGLDVIGLSMTHADRIRSFAEAHWSAQPWMRDVAARTRARLD
jgi:3-isopropylmalate/(R)-2-methylmalate dehydratase small subunit